MTISVDEHVGQRLFRRRRLLGLTQDALGQRIGIRFQQIQKYECGLNRINASRLYQLCIALDVSSSYFFAGLPGPAFVKDSISSQYDLDVGQLNDDETRELIKAYYGLGIVPRRRLLDLAISMQRGTDGAGRPSSSNALPTAVGE